jgi:hypothetical protein
LNATTISDDGPVEEGEESTSGDDE